MGRALRPLGLLGVPVRELVLTMLLALRFMATVSCDCRCWVVVVVVVVWVGWCGWGGRGGRGWAGVGGWRWVAVGCECVWWWWWGGRGGGGGGGGGGGRGCEEWGQEARERRVGGSRVLAAHAARREMQRCAPPTPCSGRFPVPPGCISHCHVTPCLARPTSTNLNPASPFP